MIPSSLIYPVSIAEGKIYCGNRAHRWKPVFKLRRNQQRDADVTMSVAIPRPRAKVPTNWQRD